MSKLKKYAFNKDNLFKIEMRYEKLQEYVNDYLWENKMPYEGFDLENIEMQIESIEGLINSIKYGDGGLSTVYITGPEIGLAKRIIEWADQQIENNGLHT